MLSRYQKKDGFWPVPNTDCNYFANTLGKVKIKNGSILEPFIINDEYFVNINWYRGYGSYKVSEIISHTFKPTHVHVFCWSLLNIIYKDENKLNVKAENLIWKFVKPIESFKYPGFYFIPGFSRFLINRECIAIDSITGNVRNSHNKDNYIYYSVKPDVGDWTLIGRHRLLCLAFKDYDHNVNKMDVNHIDGIPGNDDLDNLEFVTRTYNCNHAIKLGLKVCVTPPKRVPVLVRNIKTDQVFEYKSKKLAAKALDISIATYEKYLKAENQPVFYGDVQTKLKSDNTPWRTDIDLNNISYHEFHSRRITVEDLKNNASTIYPSMNDCAKALSVSRDTIHWRLKNAKNPILLNRYRIAFLNS